ncbi:peptidase domain-containing ABC transporter [Chitinophaga nivalis]|uniref:Peptidase domain-containing ABC transporter n=1 Tax=Chitinophaga nivalis TaxID=2991709 RepID=A0ABT3II17_9BACT|nr:peptidase domain-containing ABC transporter [Chitinophaga nivalis]MCW3466693.1 peptidase domain-containing ABC transporter [Chitinophaga nivalis]MCW3483616.1 peptidase domain-containing ABC transporter [Chitinophaga nivalis]
MFQKSTLRKSFPFHKQSDAMDCGPTCLKMIAAYYGKVFSLQHLRNISKLTRQGVTFADLIATAEILGFKTLSAALPLEVLATKAPLPCILHWEQQHFVVLYRITNTHAYLADPALGRRSKKTLAELTAGWEQEPHSATGRALFLEPTAAFYEQTAAPGSNTSLWSLLPYLRLHKGKVMPVAASLLLAGFFSFVTPVLTQQIVDKGIRGQNIHLVWLICIGQLLLFLGRMVMDFVRARVLFRAGTLISIQLLKDFLLKLMRLPLSFFDNRHAGDNMQRVSDNQRMEDFLTTSLVTLVLSVITILVLGGTLLYYNSWIFLLFLVGAAAGIGWANAFQEQRRVLDQKKFKLLAANQHILLEIFSAMQEIKISGTEQIKSAHWEQLQEKSAGLKLESLRMDQFIQGTGAFINEFKNVLITCLAATLVINGQITLGAMLAITFICGQLNAPVLQLADFIRIAQNARFSLQRLAEVHQEPDEDAPNAPPAVLSAITGKDIRLENVSFQYGHAHSPMVLNNIHLTLPAGKITAIVGMSGGGKTTLIKLLLKFYQPVAGNIYLGNTPFSELSAKSWRSHCGVVMQDGYVFMDTIANNIFAGAAERDYERLYEAGKMACIHDFFLSMPFGYDTMVGKDGYGLSEGQTQRLLIARLIYRNPAFIFLDEATNSLDAHNERAIIENLDRFFPGKTVLVVAHRLSTVKHADQIIVMHQGSIVESGTHQELIRQESTYYHLIKNQLELGK